MPNTQIQQWPSGKPRYMLLADALLGDILSGRYPVGDKLPTEHQLCRQYGVSRYTVRGAMRRLGALGLIKRQKSVGTTVISNRPSDAYIHAVGSLADLAPTDADTILNVLKTTRITADDGLSRLLDCRPGRNWLKLEGFCVEDNQSRPLGWCTIFIDGVYAGIRDQIRDDAPPLSLIEKTYGVTIEEVAQEIEAIEIPADVAQRLGVETGAPGLSATHRFYDGGGNVLQVANSIHATGRAVYRMHLKRHRPR